MKRSLSMILLSVPLFGGFLSCAQAPAGFSDADRQAIEQITQEFGEAFRAGDWAAVAALYTEDAVLMPPNHAAVRGPDAIQEFMSSFPPTTAFDLQGDEIDGCGDLAYVRGTYSMTLAPEGAEPVEESGKYVEIRRKQPDGRWLLAVDIFNSNEPLPPAPSMESEETGGEMGEPTGSTSP